MKNYHGTFIPDSFYDMMFFTVKYHMNSTIVIWVSTIYGITVFKIYIWGGISLDIRSEI